MKVKRTKKYKPKPINARAIENAIHHVKPLSQDDKDYLYKQAFAAINAMQFGRDLTKSDFTVLCDMLNISLIFSKNGIGNEYYDELNDAREAMQDSKQRHLKTGKLGFNASELVAVKNALSIHGSQIEVCTGGEFIEAFDKQNKMINQGNYYKREGDLSVGNRVAA